jgi:DNA-binding NtrC family response regulator
VAAEGDQLADVQRAHIIEVLRRERGNKARTARALGVNRRSLYRLLEKYHIELLGDEDSPVHAPGVPMAH